LPLLTVRRAASGIAEPLELGDLFRAQAQDLFVALGYEPATFRAGDGVAVPLEPCLVSSELMMAVRADDTQRGGELIRQRPLSCQWLAPGVRTGPPREGGGLYRRDD
jgi:hypothetical protein